MGFFSKLKGALQKTTAILKKDIRDLFKAGDLLDESKLSEFEKRLLRTDMGVDFVPLPRPSETAGRNEAVNE